MAATRCCPGGAAWRTDGGLQAGGPVGGPLGSLPADPAGIDLPRDWRGCGGARRGGARKAAWSRRLGCERGCLRRRSPCSSGAGYPRPCRWRRKGGVHRGPGARLNHALGFRPQRDRGAALAGLHCQAVVIGAERGGPAQRRVFPRRTPVHVAGTAERPAGGPQARRRRRDRPGT